MAQGELVTLSDAAEVRAFKLSGAPEAREYEVIVHSASTIPGSSSPVSLSVRAEGASANIVGTSVPPVQRSAASRALERQEQALLSEMRLKDRMRDELLRVGARPYRERSGTGGPRLSLAAAAPPSLGQRLTLSMAVQQDLTVDCNSSNTITAEVKLVGQNFALLEDVRVAGNYSMADYQELNQALDAVVFPLDVEYFGNPSDIDGNQRVLVLFTASVNELTEAGSGSFIAGFFFSGDVADQATCPAGNESELLYLQAPDPSGQFGDPVDVEFAKRVAKGTVSHEFLHLLNTVQRTVIGNGDFSDLDDSWSDEGLAHIAEEISGLALANLAVRANLNFEETVPTQAALDAFNAYHLFNFSRFGDFLNNPSGTLALGESGGGDPGGSQSLEMRGFAWGFLRWLADQYGPATPAGILPGSAEYLLFQELSSGGPNYLRGTSNVVRAVQVVSGQSRSWEQLIGEYLSAVVADDNGSGLDPSSQFLTWNMRELYLGLNQSNLGTNPPFEKPYPLTPMQITLNSTTNTSPNFTLRSSTGRYFTLQSAGTTPDVVLEITTQSGADVPGSVRAQVTILRVR
jgi:hypothetical protein